jgi:uncharacterized protein YecT (DUF1311 family)
MRQRPINSSLSLTLGLLLTLCGKPSWASDERLSAISGSVGYPSEEVPAMRVYAFASDGMSYYTISTKRQQKKFLIPNVPAGQYYLVAYPSEATGTQPEAGGWSQFVTCGMTVNCKDHSLILVTAKAGETASGIDVADWYAPIDAFPAEPTTLPRRNPLANECATIANQIERDKCNFTGYTAANTRLNESYERLISAPGMTAKCKERLVEDQRTWLTYRDDHCAAPATGYKGHISECLRGATEQRLAFMQKQTPGVCGP